MTRSDLVKRMFLGYQQEETILSFVERPKR